MIEVTSFATTAERDAAQSAQLAALMSGQPAPYSVMPAYVPIAGQTGLGTTMLSPEVQKQFGAITALDKVANVDPRQAEWEASQVAVTKYFQDHPGTPTNMPGAPQYTKSPAEQDRANAAVRLDVGYTPEQYSAGLAKAQQGGLDFYVPYQSFNKDLGGNSDVVGGLETSYYNAADPYFSPRTGYVAPYARDNSLILGDFNVGNDYAKRYAEARRKEWDSTHGSTITGSGFGDFLLLGGALAAGGTLLAGAGAGAGAAGGGAALGGEGTWLAGVSAADLSAAGYTSAEIAELTAAGAAAGEAGAAGAASNGLWDTFTNNLSNQFTPSNLATSAGKNAAGQLVLTGDIDPGKLATGVVLGGIGSAAAPALNQTLGNTVLGNSNEFLAADQAQLLEQGVSGAQLDSVLNSGFGTTNAVTGALSSGLTTSGVGLLAGQDPKTALTGGLTNATGSLVGSGVGALVGNTPLENVGNTLSGAAKGATGALINGRDPLTGLLYGGASGAGGDLASALSEFGLPSWLTGNLGGLAGGYLKNEVADYLRPDAPARVPATGALTGTAPTNTLGTSNSPTSGISGIPSTVAAPVKTAEKSTEVDLSQYMPEWGKLTPTGYAFNLLQG